MNAVVMIGERQNTERCFMLDRVRNKIIPFRHDTEAVECQSGVYQVYVFADSEIDCRYGPGKHSATGYSNKGL